ncbi:unnamed protein product [Durusdinium trenchii]|uniref:Ferric oxidoreductase domain-containing protein n=1 Tax=Durusdinium trenchii TaxID=1381693 RepID=A0ABP0PM59_9DINO
MRTAVLCLLLVSALYEPLRNSLWRVLEVGGVGGVGGLCNLGNPGTCSSLAGRTQNYCFIPGIVAGFTSMAILVLILWTLPMFLGGVRMAATKTASEEMEPQDEGDEMTQVTLRCGTDGFTMLWNGLSALWFVVPLAYFLADPFFHQGILNIILGVAVAAAFPLSWHLSFVALPLSSPLMLGLKLSRPSLMAIHKFLGFRSAFWGALHVTGEIMWLARSGFENLSLSDAKGENLLYILGLAAAGIFLTHVLVALARRQSWLRPYFKETHRVIAVLLLITATAHWWPFAFFLLPAAAAYGASTAERVAWGAEGGQQRMGAALASAVMGGLLGLIVVWVFRQEYMQRPSAGALEEKTW